MKLQSADADAKRRRLLFSFKFLSDSLLAFAELLENPAIGESDKKVIEKTIADLALLLRQTPLVKNAAILEGR